MAWDCLRPAASPARARPAEVVVGAGEPTEEAALAQEALVTFFDKLAAGRYAEVADYFGGDYAALIGWNPDVDQSDYATLWRNGCSINGLNCLATRSVTVVDAMTGDQYLFSVEFSTREGDKFVLRPGPDHGGGTAAAIPLRHSRGSGRRWALPVIDLPPYTP